MPGKPSPKTKKKVSRGGLYGRGKKAEATKLHALIVRSAGKCAKCGGTQNLQCAHIYSRRYNGTRTDLENALCLDAKCHRMFTDRPLDFARWCREKFGQTALDKLALRARGNFKIDWEQEVKRLKTIAKERGIDA